MPHCLVRGPAGQEGDARSAVHPAGAHHLVAEEGRELARLLLLPVGPGAFMSPPVSRMVVPPQ
jgi:hypothetical protein